MEWLKFFLIELNWTAFQNKRQFFIPIIILLAYSLRVRLPCKGFSGNQNRAILKPPLQTFSRSMPDSFKTSVTRCVVFGLKGLLSTGSRTSNMTTTLAFFTMSSKSLSVGTFWRLYRSRSASDTPPAVLNGSCCKKRTVIKNNIDAQNNNDAQINNKWVRLRWMRSWTQSEPLFTN